jgi:anti-sigma factor RsiW
MSLHVADTSESAAPPHVDDGDLLRLEDAELEASERARVVSHLSTCVRCSGRRAALVAVAARLNAATRSAQMPAALAVPPWHRASIDALPGVVRVRRPPASLAPRALGTAVRAAAALGLLAVAAAAATPLRGWIVSHVRRPVTPLTRSSVRQPRSGRTPDVAASHTASLSFVPTSDVLTIGLVAMSGDSIEVRPTESEAVHVHAISTGGEPTLIVKPDRLELVSARQGLTAYAVDVPPNVRVIDVRDASRVLVHLTRAALDARGSWRGVLP